MKTIKEIEDKITNNAHLEWLPKTKTVQIDGSELTVIPYGFLSQAVKKAIKQSQIKLLESVVEMIERFKTEIPDKVYTTKGGALTNIYQEDEQNRILKTIQKELEEIIRIN